MSSIMKVDRETFVQWALGIIMGRDSDGNVCVMPEAAMAKCRVAKKVLDHGITVFMTSGGRPVSTMRKVGGEYVETRLYTENFQGK